MALSLQIVHRTVCLTLAFEPRYLLLDCRMKYGQSILDCPYFIGGDNGARRNVKRISESLANCQKRRVYADNRYIPSHDNQLSFNPYHTKNDLKKTKSRPTTGSINNLHHNNHIVIHMYCFHMALSVLRF